MDQVDVVEPLGLEVFGLHAACAARRSATNERSPFGATRTPMRPVRCARRSGRRARSRRRAGAARSATARRRRARPHTRASTRAPRFAEPASARPRPSRRGGSRRGPGRPCRVSIGRRRPEHDVHHEVAEDQDPRWRRANGARRGGSRHNADGSDAALRSRSVKQVRWYDPACMTQSTTPTLERLAIDTIRTLSIDAVQKANSGHPGAPMGAAPMAFVLWTRFLRHAPTQPALARPRPLRAVRGPRLDAPVLAAAPHRLRPRARRAQAVPPVGLAHARPPRVRPDARRRGHDRPARPGLRQRGRHGDRRAAPRRASSTATATTSSTTGPTSSPPTATSRRASRPRRRRSPATCGSASSSSSTTTTTSSSTGPRTWPGREDVLERFEAYGWGTAAGRRRQRPRGDRGGDPRGAGRRAAVAHRGPHPHRLRQPATAGHPEGARRAARRGRGPPDQGGLRLGPGHARSTSRTRSASTCARPSTRARTWSPSGSRASTAYRDALPGRGRGAPAAAARPPAATAGTRACKPTTSATELATRNASQDAIQALAGAAAGAVRRLGGPVRVQPHRRQGDGRGHFEADDAGPQPPVRRPRARDGRRSRTASPTTAASSRTRARS